MTAPFGKCRLTLGPVWIPVKRWRAGISMETGQIPNLFLHPGSNPNFLNKKHSKENKPAWG